jgi:hypothetical protein
MAHPVLEKFLAVRRNGARKTTRAASRNRRGPPLCSKADRLYGARKGKGFNSSGKYKSIQKDRQSFWMLFIGTFWKNRSII